jgi:hypothetical protein
LRTTPSSPRLLSGSTDPVTSASESYASSRAFAASHAPTYDREHRRGRLSVRPKHCCAARDGVRPLGRSRAAARMGARRNEGKRHHGPARSGRHALHCLLRAHGRAPRRCSRRNVRASIAPDSGTRFSEASRLSCSRRRGSTRLTQELRTDGLVSALTARIFATGSYKGSFRVSLLPSRNSRNATRRRQTTHLHRPRRSESHGRSPNFERGGIARRREAILRRSRASPPGVPNWFARLSILPT